MRQPILILIALFMLTGGHASAAPTPKDPLVLKWEYKTLDVQPGDKETDEALNRLGEEGWECIGSIGTKPAAKGFGAVVHVLLFKRPKK